MVRFEMFPISKLNLRFHTDECPVETCETQGRVKCEETFIETPLNKMLFITKKIQKVPFG